jgi:hypothetical protein
MSFGDKTDIIVVSLKERDLLLQRISRQPLSFSIFKTQSKCAACHTLNIWQYLKQTAPRLWNFSQTKRENVCFTKQQIIKKVSYLNREKVISLYPPQGKGRAEFKWLTYISWR